MFANRTFQNGLSDPDFRYRPRQFGERRGKYIKVEQTPCRGFSTSSGAGEPVEEDRIGWETVLEEFQPKRRGGERLPSRGSSTLRFSGLFSPPCWAGVIPKDPSREQDLTPDCPRPRNPSPGATQEGSRGGRTPRTFRGYGRRDRPAAEEGLGGPSSSSLFQGLFLDFKPQARCKGSFGLATCRFLYIASIGSAPSISLYACNRVSIDSQKSGA
ncbi:hypothetical protein MTP99_015950 [Tenebrio molitor]|nr:hypothetical protein MTP99_015950 [Tenebrio molitor]